jgi:hypothetical protein
VIDVIVFFKYGIVDVIAMGKLCWIMVNQVKYAPLIIPPDLTHSCSVPLFFINLLDFHMPHKTPEDQYYILPMICDGALPNCIMLLNQKPQKINITLLLVVFFNCYGHDIFFCTRLYLFR